MSVTTHLQNIIEKNYQITKETFCFLLYDDDCPLSKILAESYQSVVEKCPHESVNIHAHSEEAILTKLSSLPKSSLVILVESTSFRLSKFRLRKDLIAMGHMVIEHARLSYMREEEMQHYLNALTYNTPEYVRIANAMEQLLTQCQSITYESEAGTLTIDSPTEKPVKNTGQFTEFKNAGFPIGELFTESKDLSKVNGAITVFAIPTTDHKILFSTPFSVTIKNGLVVSHTGPQAFEDILELIKRDEEVVQVRELGFGMNPWLGPNNHINEPTAFERFCGVHFSLGKKHDMYRRKLGRKTLQKYHFDLFCKVDCIQIDEKQVFENGKYSI